MVSSSRRASLKLVSSTRASSPSSSRCAYSRDVASCASAVRNGISSPSNVSRAARSAFASSSSRPASSASTSFLAGRRPRGPGGRDRDSSRRGSRRRRCRCERPKRSSPRSRSTRSGTGSRRAGAVLDTSSTTRATRSCSPRATAWRRTWRASETPWRATRRRADLAARSASTPWQAADDVDAATRPLPRPRARRSRRARASPLVAPPLATRSPRTRGSARWRSACARPPLRPRSESEHPARRQQEPRLRDSGRPALHRLPDHARASGRSFGLPGSSTKPGTRSITQVATRLYCGRSRAISRDHALTERTSSRRSRADLHGMRSTLGYRTPATPRPRAGRASSAATPPSSTLEGVSPGRAGVPRNTTSRCSPRRPGSVTTAAPTSRTWTQVSTPPTTCGPGSARPS